MIRRPPADEHTDFPAFLTMERDPNSLHKKAYAAKHSRMQRMVARARQNLTSLSWRPVQVPRSSYLDQTRHAGSGDLLLVQVVYRTSGLSRASGMWQVDGRHTLVVPGEHLATL